jgi:hypothetical protein
MGAQAAALAQREAAVRVLERDGALATAVPSAAGGRDDSLGGATANGMRSKLAGPETSEEFATALEVTVGTGVESLGGTEVVAQNPSPMSKRARRRRVAATAAAGVTKEDAAAAKRKTTKAEGEEKVSRKRGRAKKDEDEDKDGRHAGKEAAASKSAAELSGAAGGKKAPINRARTTSASAATALSEPPAASAAASRKAPAKGARSARSVPIPSSAAESSDDPADGATKKRKASGGRRGAATAVPSRLEPLPEDEDAELPAPSSQPAPAVEAATNMVTRWMRSALVFSCRRLGEQGTVELCCVV